MGILLSRGTNLSSFVPTGNEEVVAVKSAKVVVRQIDETEEYDGFKAVSVELITNEGARIAFKAAKDLREKYINEPDGTEVALKPSIKLIELVKLGDTSGATIVRAEEA